MREAVNGRDRILAAAERLVAEQGVRELTIENVAVAAGMSRGGVLYHFPSKEALIQGMLARFITGFEQFITDAAAHDPEPRGSYARAFARASFGVDAQFVASFTPIIAAIAYDPHLLDPLRDHLREWRRRAKADLDPTTANIVLLASYALWLDGLFAFHTLDTEERRTVVAHLVAMTQDTSTE